MPEEISKSPHQDELMQRIDDARVVAQAKPPAYDQIRSTDGDTEYMSVADGPKITLVNEFMPGAERTRINAQTTKHVATPVGNVSKHYTAKVINSHYPDGENIATGPLVEIHGKHDDGTEYTRTSKNPAMVRMLGGLIAGDVVEKLKNR